ncbi:MAG: hypothetical protein FJ027_06630 [Candidatus Rokubacteria bacterium]|nr:hypothetical protein [Candidatus Rokubacteria bacterium]
MAAALAVVCAGTSPALAQGTAPAPKLDIEPAAGRWRLIEPLGAGEKPRSPLYDPYSPNVLKGDYPLWGDKVFFAATGVLDFFVDFKRNLDFFEGGRFRNVPYTEHNILGQITAAAFFEIFHGDTVFAPKDWALRVAPIMRFRCGDLNANSGGCGDHWTMQEAFGELKLFEIGETFDATSARAGLQGFNSGFFGLVYNDVQPGFRIFSELARNQYKVNLAFFDRLAKEKLSALNEFKRREHHVGVLSLQWDDFILPGFNILPNFVFSSDNAPDVVTGGRATTFYFGVETNGRIDRFNVASAFYWVTGHTAHNTPNRLAQEISAGMAFVQAAYPIAFMTPRLAVAYATGDHDVQDRHAGGFDSVFDNTAFAGGQFSYLFGEKIQLGATTVLRGNSVFPSLRGANATSQYVNPGVFAINPGIDMALTPKTTFEANYAYVRFDKTEPLRAAAGNRDVSNVVGHELNAGVAWRPLLNEQVILFAGGAVFLPGQGIKDTFNNDDPVYKTIVRLVLTF